MGVTNGFLALEADEFNTLKDDAAAFQARAQAFDADNGYLDMDKAGYELLYLFDPSIMDPECEPAPYPSIAEVLGGGDAVFPDIDLGYGPARIIPEEILSASISEFDSVGVSDLLALAENEEVACMLMSGGDPEDLREYHWPYLESLAEFIRSASAKKMVVLRY